MKRRMIFVLLLLCACLLASCAGREPTPEPQTPSDPEVPASTDINYVLDGGALPSGDWDSYDPNTNFPLPTPTREGYAFSGWFSSPDFDISSITNAIPKGTSGSVTVYAKWNRILSALDGSMLGEGEDNSANSHSVTRTTNGDKENTELRNAFSVEDGALLWKQGNSKSSQLALTGDLFTALDGAKQFTFTFRFSVPEGSNPATSVFRLKISGKSLPVFKTKKSGIITLGTEGAAEILTLGSTEVTFSVTVDFESGTLTAYNGDGLAIVSVPLEFAESDAKSTTLDEAYGALTQFYWQWYSQASGSTATDHKRIKIHEISMYVGSSAIRIGRDDYNNSERDKLLDEYKSLYEEQRDRIAEGALLGVATENIGTPIWAQAPTAPTEEHPRLLVTKDTLPLVKEMLKEGNATNIRFLELLESEHPTGGILGEPILNYDGRDGLHNYDKSTLELIQIKALGYLVEGHELFGYQAIYYMKNFLLTLDIQYISSDQCHEYGHTMFTAALVYDWCYDLLTEEDKAQLIAGVETRTASGYCGDPSYTSNPVYKQKMEVGFPPAGQGSVSGHGAGAQVLKNYLAAAIAFYGDNDSWWDYVAARIYSDYVPVRNYYYQSGLSPQGTGVYVSTRLTYDLFSAWMLKTATGENPYVGLDMPAQSLLGYECASNTIFTEGDGTYETRNYYPLIHATYITAYLYGDSELLAWSEDILGAKAFEADTKHLTSAIYAALRGMSNTEPAADRYAGMSLIQYNGHPVGQYIVHEEWNSLDSAAVYMKIKELNTSNHEHEDAGTFEIYYKGMLTSDGGCYNVYGKPQTKYYHQATVSHNGLIVFDPSKWDYTSTDLAKKWYSGSQIAPGAVNSLEELLTLEECKTGSVTGRSHGYSDAEETDPKYAYIAGDITAAYPKDTVDYVGRRMLAVYTGNSDFPLAFFVYDDITSDSPDFEKRFLLQITSKSAPTVDAAAGSIVTENGDGRLVLTCLTEGVEFRSVGGRNEGTYSASKSMNYCINGYQCIPESDKADDKHWGRVEIFHTAGSSKDARFMNLIYVTDAGSDKSAEVDGITEANGVEGGVFNQSIVALFATSRDRATSELSCTVAGSGSLSYYVSGVAAGKWTVSVNGESVGSFEATEEGGLLTFTAPAGKITVSPRK